MDAIGPVRDALVVQTHRLSRPGPEREDLERALLDLVAREDRRLLLPLRGGRLCRALEVPGHREAEDAAREAGVLPPHRDEVLAGASAEMIREVDKLIGSPRKAAKTFKRILSLYPEPKPGKVDEVTLRVIRRLATGKRAKKRGTRER